MFLDYFALFILIFVVVFMFYGVIVIHDIPYEIAKKRNHPQQDALHVAGWVSLFTLHAIWPFLWIWATLYWEDRGWGFKTPPVSSEGVVQELAEVKSRVAMLEEHIQAFNSAGSGSPQPEKSALEPVISPATPEEK